MKAFKIAFALSALGLSSITLAQAGTITINGKIYDETCVLSGSDNATGQGDLVAVVLNTIPASSFSSSQLSAGKKDFSVTLTKSDGTTACYSTALATTLGPIVTLTATGNTGANLPNITTGTKSTSNPVAVQILAKQNSGDTSPVAVDYTVEQTKAPYDITNNKFYYAAQYYAVDPNNLPVAQDVQAQVTYNITYP